MTEDKQKYCTTKAGGVFHYLTVRDDGSYGVACNQYAKQGRIEVIDAKPMGDSICRRCLEANGESIRLVVYVKSETAKRFNEDYWSKRMAGRILDLIAMASEDDWKEFLNHPGFGKSDGVQPQEWTMPDGMLEAYGLDTQPEVQP